MIQSVFHFIPEVKLGGESLAAYRPIFNLNSWLDGNLQKYIESLLDKNIGLRGYFIRTDNQINYWLFGQIYQKTDEDIVVGKNHYLFEQKYIDSYIGIDKINLEKLNKQIELLINVQNKLEINNKLFLLVIAPNKASFFNEYIPNSQLKNTRVGDLDYNYLVLIEELEKRGVNYWDGKKFFLEEKNRSLAPLFTKSGTHWTVYGSCLVAQKVINKINSQKKENYNFPQCGLLNWSDKPLGQDADLLNLSNIWLTSNFEERLAYPKTTPVSKINNIDLLLIGDSFSWNILKQLESGPFINSYDFAYYFNTLSSFPNKQTVPISKQNDDFLKLINSHDVIIIEVNESGVSDIGWGFLEKANEVL